MNEKIEVPTMKVPPLKKICMTIGQLPASYVESMSYYEMLVWFVNYLRDDIIPVVNANGEATKELQELYVELQEYVNNYFDNLDVQEEINNKLDDMVEQGTLQEIIAEYLNSKALFGFDTINDMKEATNLINGSYARVLGKNNLNDGFQVTYKIREQEESDVPDNINIVLLDNGLIAEKINNFVSQYIEDFVLYAFFDDTNNEISLYISRDNLHLQKLDLTNSIQGRDPSITFYNNKFYIAVTNYSETHDFIIYESEDLINWKTNYINVGLYDATYQKRWCPDFFIDNDDLYVFISKQYADSIDPDGWGEFETYITKCNDIDTMNFSIATKITLIDNVDNNYIDPCCIKINGIYHLLVKNDTQTEMTIDHFISNDLENFTFVKSDFPQLGRYVEGQFVYKFKDTYVIGCEKYLDRNSVKSIYKIKTSTDFENFSNYRTMFVKDVDLSHGSACVITDKKAKEIIFNTQNYGFKYDYNFNLNDKKNYLIAGTTTTRKYEKGKYLKLLSVKPKHAYKSFSLLIHLYDAERNLFDSLIQIEGAILTYNPFTSGGVKTTQLTGKQQDNLKLSNLHGKIIGFTNSTNKSFDFYLDLTDYENTDIIPMINIVSLNVYDEDVEIYSDLFTDSLPITPGGINSGYRCKNLFSGYTNLYIDNGANNKLTIKFCMYNGTFKLLGHGNGIQPINTYEYTINALNGTINAISNSDYGSPLTIALDDFTAGVYTISITGIPPYSGFNITLPTNGGSSILDYQLSSV